MTNCSFCHTTPIVSSGQETFLSVMCRVSDCVSWLRTYMQIRIFTNTTKETVQKEESESKYYT